MFMTAYDHYIKRFFDKSRRGVVLVWVAALLLLVAVILGWGMVQQARSPQGKIVTLQEHTGFPLFFPVNPPQEFTFNEVSLSRTEQAVLYSYMFEGKKPVTVAVQPTGNGFDPGQFKPTSEFTTTIGKVYVLDNDFRTTAAVVAEKSFLLINVPDRIAVDKLTAFVNSLRPVK